MYNERFYDSYTLNFIFKFELITRSEGPRRKERLDAESASGDNA